MAAAKPPVSTPGPVGGVNPGDGTQSQPPITQEPPLMNGPVYNDPATPGTSTGVEYPDGGDQYQRGDDYNYHDPYYDESGLQTGVGGKLNERINLGVDPKLLNYTQQVYENSPYANQNYNVKPGQTTAHGRTAQENEMSAYHLEQMLASDSPLMARARSQAMAGAGGRGLMNSSIAQGAAMGSMIDRAQAFALQDATSHGRAAQETLANKQSASNLNANLASQAGIAGMQARASRDSQLLASELGANQDLLRHQLGMETREDQQAWQEQQNADQREFATSERVATEGWQGDQNQMNRDFEDSQNRLKEQFQWADNRQQAIERWAEGEFSVINNRASNREQALSQIAASIFGNHELTAAEQNAAWASAQAKMGALYDSENEQQPSGPTWTDPGYPGAPPPAESPTSDPEYKAPAMASSAQGQSTQPYISQQNQQLNKATGQVYNSPSSPGAAKVTEALPPII